MKRSQQVQAGLLSALALSLTGCGDDEPKQNAQPPEARRCVNDQNVVVDDKDCNDNRGGSHWYYGGFGGFFPGSVVTGGSTTSNNDSASRGGIGKSAGSGSGTSSGG